MSPTVHFRLGQPPFRPFGMETEDFFNRLRSSPAGFDLPVITLKQIHGTEIVVADSLPPDFSPPEGDGLVITKPGRAIGVWTADCLPVVLWDQEGRGAAILHCGWRGLFGGIIDRGVERLAKISRRRPSQLMAAMGPAIGPCCYQVGPDLLAVARDMLSTSGDSFFDQRPDGLFFDLPKAARQLLLDAGLPTGHIWLPNKCTRCHPDLYPSYRRDGDAAGRMLSLAWMV